jgi:hypothetical protein
MVKRKTTKAKQRPSTENYRKNPKKTYSTFPIVDFPFVGINIPAAPAFHYRYVALGFVLKLVIRNICFT